VPLPDRRGGAGRKEGLLGGRKESGDPELKK
jgi:hypothetical protein